MIELKTKPNTELKRSHNTQGPKAPRRTALGFFYVICATILWSISPVCIKIALRSVDAFSLGWIRFAMGAVVLFGLGRARGNTMALRRQHLWLAIIGGVALGLNHTIYIKGVQYTTASASGVIVQLEVISLVILSYFLLKDRISPMKGFGMLLTLSGVFVAAWNGQSSIAALLASENQYGNLLVTISAPLWAVYAIAQKLMSDRGIAVSSSIFYVFAFASIATLPTAMIYHHITGPLDLRFYAVLAVFVLFASVGACGMMAKGFEMLDASTAGVITSFFPVVTIAMAWIFLGETPSVEMWLGGGLAVAGILIIGITEAMRVPEPVERQ